MIRYKESLKNTQRQMPTREPVPIDYKGLIEYAKTCGKEPVALSEEEKVKFILT